MSNFCYERRVRNYPESGEGYFIALQEAGLEDFQPKKEPERELSQAELFEKLNPQLK